MTEIRNVLQHIEDLAGVPAEQLEWLISQSERVEFKPGSFLFSRDQPIDHMAILLEGKIRVLLEQKGRFREVDILEAGAITGVLPFSRLKKAVGYGEIVIPSTLLLTHRDRFAEMIRDYPELTTALVHVLTTRVRDYTSLQVQNEKLMALGKLSAGLAHELNNPAAAVMRSARALKDHLSLLPERFKDIMALRLSDAQVNAVNQLLFSKVSEGNRTPLISMMQRNQEENEVAEWLEAHGLSDGFELASSLVEFGMLIPELEQVEAEVGTDFFPTVANWLGNVLNTEKMVRDIEEASGRIAHLLTAMKAYSYMDQDADRQEVDVHAGLRNTLTLLQHKIRYFQVEIEEDFAPDLPPVLAFPGELNQVWTNLIDNALDAMEKGGKLEIRTRRQNEYVEVRLIDNGPGIPADALPHIFEPFYTTKPMGKGTGLGLDAVMKIINHHHGDIRVDSQPGRTEFCVRLPIS